MTCDAHDLAPHPSCPDCRTDTVQIVARSERVTLERERDEWRRRAIVAEARVVRLTEALLELRPFASRPCRAVIDAALAEDGGAG